ncbi:MAG: TonB-dependent receptor [Xanthomonadales bacterium]|nr:TonB-dependent receptor [Xanthomonadales bacterium]
MWMLLWTMYSVGAVPDEPQEIEVVTVVSRRTDRSVDLPASVHAISEQPAATHPNEIFSAAPGGWISRGSGQEHLTALRSPVLTGAGACGAFLYLENGIPVRPPGFCNVNNLFELIWERAEAHDVLLGPGSALHGSNALHGAINARMPGPGHSRQLRLDIGEHDLVTGHVELGGDQWVVSAVGTSSGSFRALEGYDQQKLYARYDFSWRGASVENWFSATNLNQETAGFILGFESYRDPELRRANLNPEAYRDNRAFRAASRWTWDHGDWSFELTPFARSNRMEFLQHFLPGKPLEENGQDSFGVQLLARRQFDTLELTAGLDLDHADGFLRQTQDGPVEDGSPFLIATRPAGAHYDYQVDALTQAIYGELLWNPVPAWTVAAGLRAERTDYSYDNRLADGNLREDGTACGFGGCLYNRPGDRDDDFSEIAPKFSLSRHFDDGSRAYVRLARGFRAPQATELYRLQRGQDVADLDSEILDAAEVGYKFSQGTLDGSLALFYMKKDNFIFRDADGFNVSDGATRHAGVEASLAWRPGDLWKVQATATLADHSYAFSRDAALGESIQSGNEVDTAPDRLGRVAATRLGLLGGRGTVEWIHQGDYFVDAANEHRYEGHDLFHLSWRRPFEAWSIELRLENLFNTRYAERADFAFGNYRYFPGQGRTWLVSLAYDG